MASDEQKIESEATTLAGLAASEQWKLAKQKLIAKIQSATSLLDMKEEERRNPILCEARYQAAAIVGEWMLEIDGNELLHATITEADDESHVLRTGLL